MRLINSCSIASSILLAISLFLVSSSSPPLLTDFLFFSGIIVKGFLQNFECFAKNLYAQVEQQIRDIKSGGESDNLL